MLQGHHFPNRGLVFYDTGQQTPFFLLQLLLPNVPKRDQRGAIVHCSLLENSLPVQVPVMVLVGCGLFTPCFLAQGFIIIVILNFHLCLPACSSTEPVAICTWITRRRPIWMEVGFWYWTAFVWSIVQQLGGLRSDRVQRVPPALHLILANNQQGRFIPEWFIRVEDWYHELCGGRRILSSEFGINLLWEWIVLLSNFGS